MAASRAEAAINSFAALDKGRANNVMDGTKGNVMHRIVVLVLALFLLCITSWQARAQGGTPACPYYAVNSTSQNACFKSLGEAEQFIRTDTTGLHPHRKLLEQSSSTFVSNNALLTTVQINYRVRPQAGIEGPRVYQARTFPTPTGAGTKCGCETSGSTGRCTSYGSMSNCTNTPALCTYGYYCIAQSSITQAIEEHNDALNCRQDTVATASGAGPATPLNVVAAPQTAPPNSVGLAYYDSDADGKFTGQTYQFQWGPEATCGGSGGSGKYQSLIVSPLTCPAGWSVSPGDPPKIAEACVSNESGYILEYRAPVGDTGPSPCPSVPGGQCEGNPVIVSTGAKIQGPTNWPTEAMLGFALTYNSLVGSKTHNPLGIGWSSLLSTRLLGRNANSDRYLYADPVGNLELFVRNASGIFRALNSSEKSFRTTSSSPCERSVFESGRRLVFTCATTDWRLVRVEFPDDPIKTLKVIWSASEAFDENGVQTIFNNVPLRLERADGRSLSFGYARINQAADCDSYATPYACNAVRLTGITDSTGSTTYLDYDSEGRLSLLAYPDGTHERFEYGAAEDMCPSSMPGACTAPALPVVAAGLLTGTYIETPNGDGTYASVRYGIYQYDNFGRAIVTTHPGDAGRTELRYATDGTPTARLFVDSSKYRDRKFTEKRIGIYSKPTNISEISSTGAVIRSSTSTYSSLGYLAQLTDFRGVRSDWTFNDTGLPTQRVEAASDTTGKRRTIQMDWDTSNRLIKERRIYDSAAAIPGVLKSRAAWAHNARSQVTAACNYDPDNATAMAYVCGADVNAPVGVRQVVTTYCEQTDIDAGTCPSLGLVTSVNGARTDATDVTTYGYYTSEDPVCATSPSSCLYRKGDLRTVTNALGQVSEVLAYDGAGRARLVMDANGVVTDLEYDTRGHLTARKIRGTDDATESDDAITRFEYSPAGLVKKVTQPDGAFTAYTYDAARRLTDVVDNHGNSIHYTLDIAGNRVNEDTKDNAGALLRTLSRVHNQLGQLETIKDAFQQPTDFVYDLNGNSDTVTDALGRTTDNDYDPLNRLSRTLQDMTGIGAETGFEYDALDNLTRVTDPKGLDTDYLHDGLGDLTQLTSPDTGITSYTYDSTGNRKTQTDARGITATYSYDAPNRLTGISYPNSVHNITYTYDTTQAACITGETFTTGRLTKMVDGSGNTQYCYDRFGHLVRKVQTTNTKVFTVRYAYTKAGRLSSVIYPDGTTVDYVRDGQGRITEVGSTRSGSTRQVLLSQATYYPFGPVAEWVYGNGRLMQRSLNQNYQPGLVEDGFSTGISIGYEFDAAGNLAKLRNAGQNDPPQRLFGYDAINRLTEEKDGATQAVLWGYGYDATGNRTSATIGASTSTYTYPTSSHRLSQVGATTRGYDPAGNLVSIGGTAKQFGYGDSNRMSWVAANGTITQYYRYNGRGERVHKYINTTNFYTAYDEAGHWLGDYDGNGTAIQQAIWLDDLPVGLLIGAGVNQTLHYVEADALGSPRVVIDPVRDVAVWNWDIAGEAFGSTAPNQDPDGDGTNLIFHMRFPGQRYDAASGLNYNYFRDYEPGTGRYLQSDPIGLAGGISTFSYAHNNSISYSDPYGLFGIQVGQAVCSFVTDIANYWHNRKRDYYRDLSTDRWKRHQVRCQEITLGCREARDFASCAAMAQAECDRSRKDTECELDKVRNDLKIVEVWEWWSDLNSLCNLGIFKVKPPRDPVP